MRAATPLTTGPRGLKGNAGSRTPLLRASRRCILLCSYGMRPLEHPPGFWDQQTALRRGASGSGLAPGAQTGGMMSRLTGLIVGAAVLSLTCGMKGAVSGAVKTDAGPVSGVNGPD